MAGYNPAIAPDFWKRMAAVSGNKVPEILSTHPSSETRIHDLNKFMPTAMKYYKPRPQLLFFWKGISTHLILTFIISEEYLGLIVLRLKYFDHVDI